jgi:hypothetical protein
LKAENQFDVITRNRQHTDLIDEQNYNSNIRTVNNHAGNNI